jgi:hypothetical protein
VAFGGIALAIASAIKARKDKAAADAAAQQKAQADALQQQYLKAQIAHMQAGDAATATANGTGVAPYPGPAAQPAGQKPPGTPAAPSLGSLAGPQAPASPVGNALLTPKDMNAPAASTNLPAIAPTGPAPAGPATIDYSAQAGTMLKKAGDLEDQATYYDNAGATAVATRLRSQAQSYRAQAKALSDQATSTVESGTGTLPSMPKNLTQVAPGNKGKGAAPGSIPDLQAEYNHASSIASWFASGQGGDLRDPRVKAQAALWESRAVQAAGSLKEAQILQHQDAAEQVRAKAAAALHASPTWGDLHLPHGRGGGNGRGTQPADGDTVSKAEAMLQKSPDPNATAQHLSAQVRVHGGNQATVDAIVNLGNYYASKKGQRGPTKPGMFGAIAP